MARIIEVIETDDRRGRGTEADPIRLVMQWWTRDGKLLFEKDPMGDEIREKRLRQKGRAARPDRVAT